MQIQFLSLVTEDWCSFFPTVDTCGIGPRFVYNEFLSIVTTVESELELAKT